MALINCPECDHRVSESAPACPNCGFEIKAHVKAQQIAQEAKKKRTRTKRGCFGCAGLLILGFFGMALLGSLIPVEEPNNSTSSTGEPEAAQQSVEQDALTTTENSEVVVTGWIFRLMTPGDSERIRPGIPSDDAHPFRGIAATHSD